MGQGTGGGVIGGLGDLPRALETLAEAGGGLSADLDVNQVSGVRA